MIVSCISADPGPTSGLGFLEYHPIGTKEDGKPLYSKRPTNVTLLQAEGKSVLYVLEGMLRGWYLDPGITGRFASVERFITGRKAGSTGQPADVTRQLVMKITECLQLFGYQVQLRSAADVKPWGTDKRLIEAGIADKNSGLHGKLRDGFDAGRHVLYCAVTDARMPDPLFTRAA